MVVIVVVMIVVVHCAFCHSYSQRLQPMLVDVGLELVAGRTVIAAPDLALLETDLVEHLRRQAGLVVGEALGVAKACRGSMQ